MYNYVPLKYLEIIKPEKNLGSSLVTIAGTDTLSSSRTVINNNFSSLNSDKFETTGTTLANLTTANALTSASSLATVGTITSGIWNSTTIGITNGGTGTTTSVSGGLFYSDGTVFRQNSSDLFWDNTNIRLGIGTTSPYAKLSVTGAIIGEYFNATSTTGSSIFSGKVGISSSTPQRSLSIIGSAVVAECDLTDSATITFNLASCNQGRVTLGGNRTLDFTNETQALGQGIRFIVCQDGTGTRTITWDSVIRWAGGSAPSLTTGANKCDVIAGFTTMATGTPVILLDKSLNF